MKYIRSLSSLALIVTLGLSLTGCGSSSSATATSPSVEAIVPATSKATSAAPEVKKSSRGNIVKALKEPAGISDQDGKPLVNFTVNSITPDAPCTGPYPQPLENGHIVVLDVTIETMPELAGDDTRPDSFDMNGAMFKFVGNNGTTFNGQLGTIGATSCLPDEQGLPMTGIGPGERVTGKIALDLPATAGTLVFKSHLTAGNSGWEWTF